MPLPQLPAGAPTAGTVRLLFSITRLWRMTVQRGIFVGVMIGVGLGFSMFSRLHSPSCGGGGSPGFSELGSMPEELWRKTDPSIARLPPELEPE